MTARPGFLLRRTELASACLGVGRKGSIDRYEAARRASRQLPGASPEAFLNARLKAASES